MGWSGGELGATIERVRIGTTVSLYHGAYIREGGNGGVRRASNSAKTGREALGITRRYQHGRFWRDQGKRTDARDLITDSCNAENNIPIRSPRRRGRAAWAEQ
jgi:hypothetical protein